MKQTKTRKLKHKVLTLALLIGGMAFFASTRSVYAEFCIPQYNSCGELCSFIYHNDMPGYAVCWGVCATQLSGCTEPLPQPEGPPQS